MNFYEEESKLTYDYYINADNFNVECTTYDNKVSAITINSENQEFLQKLRIFLMNECKFNN